MFSRECDTSVCSESSSTGRPMGTGIDKSGSRREVAAWRLQIFLDRGGPIVLLPFSDRLPFTVRRCFVVSRFTPRSLPPVSRVMGIHFS